MREAPLKVMRRLPSQGKGSEGSVPSTSIRAGRLRFFFSDTVCGFR